MNFNDQSSPPSHRHDGSNTGLQLTILSINEAYIMLRYILESSHLGFSMTAVNDSNGDGFNNEIIFNYDPIQMETMLISRLFSNFMSR